MPPAPDQPRMETDGQIQLVHNSSCAAKRVPLRSLLKPTDPLYCNFAHLQTHLRVRLSGVATECSRTKGLGNRTHSFGPRTGKNNRCKEEEETLTRPAHADPHILNIILRLAQKVRAAQSQSFPWTTCAREESSVLPEKVSRSGNIIESPTRWPYATDTMRTYLNASSRRATSPSQPSSVVASSAVLSTLASRPSPMTAVPLSSKSRALQLRRPFITGAMALAALTGLGGLDPRDRGRCLPDAP